MLYFAYRSTIHEFMVSHLVVPGGAASYDEDDEAWIPKLAGMAAVMQGIAISRFLTKPTPER